LLCFRLRSRQVNAGQRRNAVRFSLSHFSPQAHNPESDWAGDCDQVILEKCGLVKAIRSSVHERRCTMQEHDKPHDELLLMNRKSNWNRTELLTDRFLRGLTQRIGRLFSATRTVARNASAVSDAPHSQRAVGSGGCAGRVRYSCLKEAARGEAFMQIQGC